MILITGGTGMAGSAVVREFLRLGTPMRLLVRDPDKAAGLAGLDGVEVVRGDLLDPETLGPVLDGVDRVLLISSADDRMVAAQATLIDAAAASGVGRVVKLSGLGADPGSPFRFARLHAEVERHLRDSGVAWTLLRPGQFMQVYYREVPTMLANGVFELPLGATRLAPIDLEDLARMAHEVLQGDGHEDRVYEATGPEALTMDEVCDILSEVVGKPVRYVDIDPAEKTRRLIAAGIPEHFAKDMDDLFALRRSGGPETRVQVESLEQLGIRPTTFAEFAHRSSEIFRGITSPAHLWASGWQASAGMAAG